MAPPNNTANRSSEIAPNKGFLLTTKRTPSSTLCQRHCIAGPCGRTGRTFATMITVNVSSAQAMPYTTWKPKMASTPPIEGPAITPTWNNTAFADTAPGSMVFGTRFGVIACPAGAQNARASPNNTIAPNTMRDIGAARQRETQQDDGAGEFRRVGAGDDDAAIEAVRHLAAGQHHRQERQELRETDQPQVERIARDLPHLETRDHVDHLPCQRARQATKGVTREIGLAQRLQGRRSGIGCSRGRWKAWLRARTLTGNVALRWPASG